MSETAATPAADAVPAGAVATPADAGAAPVTEAATPSGEVNTLLTAAPETPPEGEKPAAEGEVKTEGEKAAEPVEYKDLKLPEGTTADDPLVEAFVATASEKGIPQEMAETLISAMAPKVQEMLRAPQEAWKTITNEWQAQVKADPEVGGANFAAMQTTVARFLSNPAFCDPGLAEAMNMTGFGNHPAAVRSFFRIAKVLTEGGPVSPGNASPSKPAPWEVMFPNSKE